MMDQFKETGFSFWAATASLLDIILPVKKCKRVGIKFIGVKGEKLKTDLRVWGHKSV